MTPTQVERWKDFALRMAKHTFDITQPRKEKLILELESFFDWIEIDLGFEKISDWDSAPYVCDYFWEFFDRFHVHEDKLQPRHFLNQLMCCIRAGLDLASSPSGGVVGFQVIHLKQMYQGTIPQWILSQYKSEQWASDVNCIWL